MSDINLDNLHSLTVKIYYLVLQSDTPLGPNNVKNQLGLNARSKAYYHLNKLYQLELVKKQDDGRYIINQDVDTQQLLGNYIQILSTLVPKSLILAGLSMVGLIFNLVLLFIYSFSFPFIFNMVLFTVLSIYLSRDGKKLVDEFSKGLTR